MKQRNIEFPMRVNKYLCPRNFMILTGIFPIKDFR